MSKYRSLQRALALSTAFGIGGLATAGIASAHVTADVYGSPLEQGGYGAIVLRVPNEDTDFGTTKLEVTIPAEYEISTAGTKPVPGWTAEIEQDGTVTGITWTAEPGHEIPAGTTAYQEFEFTAGALPKNEDRLVLPAAQTYADGTVVNWDAEPTDDGPEPEYPAPVVPLASPAGSGHTADTLGSNDETTGADAESSSVTSDNTARWLGGAGLAVGALGLGLGVGATLRLSRKAAK